MIWTAAVTNRSTKLAEAARRRPGPCAPRCPARDGRRSGTRSDARTTARPAPFSRDGQTVRQLRARRLGRRGSPRLARSRRWRLVARGRAPADGGRPTSRPPPGRSKRCSIGSPRPPGAPSSGAGAFAWRERDPGDVLALVALGEALRGAAATPPHAARAYGSIIDLFPGPRRPAPVRRRAPGARRRARAALALAIDTSAKAVEQRPTTRPATGCWASRCSRPAIPREAFEALAVGAAQKYPAGRFAGVDRILREDLGLVGGRLDPRRARARRTRSDARLLRGGRHRRDGALAPLRPQLGDRRQRRRLPHPRRATAATPSTARRTCRRAAISTPT